MVWICNTQIKNRKDKKVTITIGMPLQRSQEKELKIAGKTRIRRIKLGRTHPR